MKKSFKDHIYELIFTKSFADNPNKKEEIQKDLELGFHHVVCFITFLIICFLLGLGINLLANG